MGFKQWKRGVPAFILAFVMMIVSFDAPVFSASAQKEKQYGEDPVAVIENFAKENRIGNDKLNKMLKVYEEIAVLIDNGMVGDTGDRRQLNVKAAKALVDLVKQDIAGGTDDSLISANGYSEGYAAEAWEFYIKNKTDVKLDVASSAFYASTKAGLIDGFLWLSIGAEKDKSGVYHTKQDWWQSNQLVGYNELYNKVFGSVTSMRSERFDFYYRKGRRVITLLAWVGDYTNLGAGAELGIYHRPAAQLSDNVYTGTQYAMPMKLKLTDTQGNQIFYWEPYNDNWWLSGFSPQMQFVDADKLKAVYTLDFSGNKDMYKDLYNAWFSGGVYWKAGRKQDQRWDFDLQNYTVTFTY